VPGLYWFATLCDGALAAKTLGTSTTALAGYVGASALSGVSNTGLVGYSASRTYASGFQSDVSGATFSSVATAVCPYVLFQVA